MGLPLITNGDIREPVTSSPCLPSQLLSLPGSMCTPLRSPWMSCKAMTPVLSHNPTPFVYSSPPPSGSLSFPTPSPGRLIYSSHSCKTQTAFHLSVKLPGLAFSSPASKRGISPLPASCTYFCNSPVRGQRCFPDRLQQGSCPFSWH